MCEFSGETNISNEGLVGWWTFDEIINNSGTLILPDMSGNSNDGVLNDSNSSNFDGWKPPQLIKSKLGNALKFDGVDDYVEVDRTKFEFKNNFSILIINKINFIDNFKKVLLRIRLYGYGFIFFNKSFINTFYYGNVTCSYINLNQLGHFLLMKIGNNTHYFYNDFVKKNHSISGNSYYVNDQMGLTFGKDGGSLTTTNYFSGIIDEIRIYNRTLTDEEVKTLYWYSIRPLQEDVNEIDVSSCNLEKNKVYNVFIGTKNNIVEKTIFNK